MMNLERGQQEEDEEDRHHVTQTTDSRFGHFLQRLPFLNFLQHFFLKAPEEPSSKHLKMHPELLEESFTM